MNDRLKTYYEVISKAERKKLLAEICEDCETGYEEKRILEYLWELRYETWKDGEKQEDVFQNAMLQILKIDELLKINLEGDTCQKQLFQLGKDLGLDDYRFQTAEGRKYFILEYGNLARNMIDLRWRGKRDHNFVKKIKNEFDTIGTKIPEKFGMRSFYEPLAGGVAMEIKKL